MTLTEKLKVLEDRTQEWMRLHAEGPYAQFWLGLISFLEASVLPLPPSAFMLVMVALGEKKRWIYLATITTITSVLGGLFGYLIGAVLYDTLGQWVINQYQLAGDIERLGELFADHAFLANLIGAFTPIPYKAFTVASGFFSINPFVFIAASIVGRGLRFYVVAYLAKVFGEHVTHRVFRYVAFITILAVAILIIVSVVGAL